MNKSITMKEYEKLRRRYEQEVLERLQTLLSTNDEAKQFYWSGEHLKPHFNYYEVIELMEKYANEGYVDCSKIDEMVAPIITDDYHIYNNFPRATRNGYLVCKSRSNGKEALRLMILFLAKVEHTQFPKLKSSLVNVFSENSRPAIIDGEECVKKFDKNELMNDCKRRMSDELFEEIFGEPKQKSYLKK